MAIREKGQNLEEKFRLANRYDEGATVRQLVGVRRHLGGS